MTPISQQEAARQIVYFGHRLDAKGYAAANDGNLSIRLDADTVLCTPTMVSKGALTEEMLVLLRMDGTVLSSGKPSSEVKMHLRVYRENPEARAVAHLHPPTATSFAAAGIPLDMPLLTEAVMGLGPIPLAPFAMPGTEEVPESIAPFCATHKGALLSNHGAITWGPTLEAACFRMETLEQIAIVTLNVRYIMKETANVISDADVERLLGR